MNFLLILPLIAPAVVAGIASILGAAIGAGGILYTNKTNKQIAESTNKQSLDAMREQTKSEQDYNSASSQMKRHMLAGYSPASLAGESPAVASSSGVPGLDAPIMQNPFGDFANLGNDLGSAVIKDKELSQVDRQLDLEEYKSKIDLLRTIVDGAKNSDLVGSDLDNMIDKVFPNDPNRPQIGSVYKDKWLQNKLTNAIESSNLDLKEKKYLFGWLDEFTNARFTDLLADIEGKQTNSLVNRSQAKLNKALQDMNEEKRNEITQAIKNMKAQFKSLNFQGELDAKKLLRIAEISDSIVDKITYETKVSKKEANSYLWRNAIMPFLQTLIQSGAYVGGQFID